MLFRSKTYKKWPDLASTHYAKEVSELIKSKKVKIVPKELNPAILTEARPIENSVNSAYLSRRVRTFDKI